MGLSLGLLGSVLLDSVQEFLTTFRVLDVLNSDAESLLHVSVSDNLVDNDTNSRLGHVVNNTGLTLVVFVRHTLVDRTIGLDVNNVSYLVDLQVSRKWDSSMFLEITLKHVTSTRSVTMTEQLAMLF